ncbi:serine/threonine-protein kinase [Telluribacter sp.]|jgi:serine/threonine-protein kinase|uniref:serine/threonine-protein kinase n=1 Tax=Telluribacter sp. TaxID=1978767 RepID=UPI002E12F946|nr:protein kinase [Telluribacter sp.]
MIGRAIQNYRVEELLGEGGMGTVYRATDTLLQRPVALKVLHSHLLRDTTFFDRFRNEAILSARLNHPNVATLYNFIKDRNDNFMVMEFVDGATLEQLLRRHGHFSVEIAVRIIVQALDGLHHAHRKGILHRDIKPANLMLTKEGSLKLMDFGIARLVGSERMTRVNRVMGTLEYLAPELLDGGEPSVQSDLYAVGVLLYELLSGKMPFTAQTDSTLINKILAHKAIPIREHIAGLPKAIEEILEKLLHKKPAQRYTDAAELRSVLVALVPPGPLDWNQFQEPVRTPRTRLSASTADKPQIEPTRLAGTSAKVAYGARLNSLKKTLLSLEGLILLGALLIAVGIAGTSLWVRSSPPATGGTAQESTSNSNMAGTFTEEEEKAPSNEVPAERTALVYEKPPANYQPTTPPDKKANPPRDKEAKPKKQKPEPTETPVQVPPTTKEEEPIAKEPTPVETEEPRRAVEKSTSLTVAVELRNESFPVEFTETITSDQETGGGRVLWLRTLAPVVVNGTTVIEAGARVRGRVTGARTATNSQRAYLAVQFEAVEAVNGQWISIRFPEYSDKDSERVVFQRNRRVNGLRVVRTSLVFKQQ